MPKLNELSQLAFKIETAAEGTAVSLAAADAVMLVYDITYTPGVEFYQRNTRTSAFSRHVGLSGKRMATLAFKFDLIGITGASRAVPQWSKLLLTAGLVSSDTGTNQVTYTPTSTWTPETVSTTVFPSLTMGFYTDGRYRSMIGARASKFAIVCEAGKPMRGEVEFIGAAPTNPTDASMLSSVTYETVIPPIFASAALSLGTLTTTLGVISSCTLDFGLTTTLREDVNSASGYRSAMVTNRKPTFTFDPEMTATADHDFYSTLTAGTTGALSISINSSSNNKITITAPIVQYTAMSEGDRGGLLTANMTCDLCRSSGNDEFLIKLGT